MSEERVIKKYANRRLYDASQSRHITLEDIRTMVVSGMRVKVVEDKTNEDITRLILLQVIADQEQFGRPILSTPLLEALIRFYGNSLQGFFSSYLEKSVETFMRQQDAVQTQFAKALQSSPLAAMTELTRQNLELWGRMQESMLQAFAPRKEPSDSAQSRDEPGGKPAAGRAQKTTTDEPPAPKSAQK
ncbi:MAG TPA: polyhydroxyalkanoate synthesis repressor PhaR [Steroidobacter sp.]|jgi:polyhydroxyalkanoate synthesis repressor PhaR|nr:polyhydroxyalkanoate synthesis repressor PhaR [Steroidobacteraceae bacterium]HLS80524.1 polyhydroxyalkanoate synthesis repressor PhaR [Steroidobacter sp.]